MPVRNWDKLRRQDRAKKNGYDPIKSFRAPKRLKGRKKRGRRKQNKVVLGGYSRVIKKRENYRPDKIMRLTVRGLNCNGTAQFERREGTWRVAWTDPRLRWMQSVPFELLKDSLEFRECSWGWKKVEVW